MHLLFKLTNEELEQKLLIFEQIQKSANEKWSREDLNILWKLFIEDWKNCSIPEKIETQLLAMPIYYLILHCFYVIAC